MKLIEWEVSEDSYQEQINIPKEIRGLAEDEGISTGVKENAAVEILNLNTGESYAGRLAITGTHQPRLPLRDQAFLQEYMSYV